MLNSIVFVAFGFLSVLRVPPPLSIKGGSKLNKVSDGQFTRTARIASSVRSMQSSTSSALRDGQFTAMALIASSVRWWEAET